MAILESHRILIGASGWLHDHWQNHFYPEDLPQDWYLGYYGNEYPVVSVREQEWQQGGEVEEWLEETDEVPLFVCELPLLASKDSLLQQAEAYLTAAKTMAHRCIGIICQVDNGVDVNQLKKLLEACKAIAPTVLAMTDIPADIETILSELSVNPLWMNANNTTHYNGNLYIAQLDSAQTKLPDLRSAMENLLAQQAEDHTLILLINGDTPDLEIIRQAKVMLDLL